MKARSARLWVGLLGLIWLGVLGMGAYYVLSRATAQPAQQSYYTKEQAREGNVAYAQHCASCHGPDLKGVSAPALVGGTFWQRWGGRPAAELYEYIQSQMPQGRGGSLAVEIYVLTTAYVLQQNGFPAGEMALEPNAPRLADLPLRRADTSSQGEQDLPPSEQGDQADDSSNMASQSGEGQPDGAGGGTQTQTGGQPSSRSQAGSQGRPVARSEAQAGDLRLTVLPEASQVRVFGPANYEESFAGGSHLLSGLTPGTYTVTASFQGEALEQRVELVGGEVAELDLAFGTASGESGTTTDAVEGTPEGTDALAGVLTDGSQLYDRHCVMCHGARGGGNIGPALSSNPRLAADEWVIRRIAGGGLGMPPFGKVLAAQELAAVTNYIRTHFGNAYGEVTPQQVRRVEEAIRPDLLSRTVVSLEDASLGQQRYTQLCSACHGLQGGGDVGPPLAGNPNLQNEQLVLTTILYGRGIMPAYSHHSDREIAEITSYIRDEWSNSYGPVGPEEVEAYRPDLAGRSQQ